MVPIQPHSLRAIANASPQGQAAPPQPAIPLTGDSLGAQLLLTVSEHVGEISHEIAGMARTLTHFPAFYWIVRTANDPSAYNQSLDIMATHLCGNATVVSPIYQLTRGDPK